MGIELGKQEARLGIPMGAYDPAASTIEIGPATEDTQGIIAIATEELAKEGVNDETAITPLKLAKVLDEKIIDAYTKEEVDTKLEGVETEITGVKADIAGVETTVQGLGTTVEGLTTNVESMQSDIDAITTQVEDVTSSVTDLATAVQGKQDKLTAGQNIEIDPETNTISATGGESKEYKAGVGMELKDDTFSIDRVAPQYAELFTRNNNPTIEDGVLALKWRTWVTKTFPTIVDMSRKWSMDFAFTPKGSSGSTDMIRLVDSSGQATAYFYPYIYSSNEVSHCWWAQNADGTQGGNGGIPTAALSRTNVKIYAHIEYTGESMVFRFGTYKDGNDVCDFTLTSYTQMFEPFYGDRPLRNIRSITLGSWADYGTYDRNVGDLFLREFKFTYHDGEEVFIPYDQIGNAVVTSSTELGLAQVDGTTIVADKNGVISAPYKVDIATTDTVGTVKPDGTTLTIDETGKLSAVKQGTDFETANPIYMDEQREYTHLHGITDEGDAMNAEVGYFSDYPTTYYGNFTHGDTIEIGTVGDQAYFEPRSYVEVPLELDTTYILPGDFTDSTGNGRGLWTPILGRKDAEGHFFPLMFPAKNSDFSYYYYNINQCVQNPSDNTARIWGDRYNSSMRYGITYKEGQKSYAFSVSSAGKMQYTSGPNQWERMLIISETQQNHTAIINRATHIRFLPYDTTCVLSADSKFGKVVGKNATDLYPEALYAQAIANAEPIADAIIKNVLTLDIDTETLAVTEEGKLSVIGGGGEAVTPDGVTIQFNENNQLKTSIDINALAEKVEDMQLFKFPNATIIGEPTIQNGQISDFSTVSYLQFPFVLDLHDRALRIDFCFTTDTNVQTQQNILDSNYGLALAIKDGKGLMAVSSTGTSWDIGQAVGTADIQSNTTYFARLIWDKTQYKTMLSTDNEHFEEDMVLDSTAHPFPRTIFIGGCDQLETGHDPHPFLGTINLNKCDVYVDDVLIWQGMDDVGLATRADVSLSNIDDDAKQVIKDIAGSGNPLIAGAPLRKGTLTDGAIQGYDIGEGRYTAQNVLNIVRKETLYSGYSAYTLSGDGVDVIDGRLVINGLSYIEQPIEKGSVYFVPNAYQNTTDKSYYTSGWLSVLGTKDSEGNFYPESMFWNSSFYNKIASPSKKEGAVEFIAQNPTRTKEISVSYNYSTPFKSTAIGIGVNKVTGISLTSNTSTSYTTYVGGYNHSTNATHIRFYTVQSSDIRLISQYSKFAVYKNLTDSQLWEQMTYNNYLNYMYNADDMDLSFSQVSDYMSLGINPETMEITSDGRLSAKSTSGGGGEPGPAGDYEPLINKPQISNHELVGNLPVAGALYLSNQPDNPCLYNASYDSATSKVTFLKDSGHLYMYSTTHVYADRGAVSAEGNAVDYASYVDWPYSMGDIGFTYALDGTISSYSYSGVVMGYYDADSRFCPVVQFESSTACATLVVSSYKRYSGTYYNVLVTSYTSASSSLVSSDKTGLYQIRYDDDAGVYTIQQVRRGYKYTFSFPSEYNALISKITTMRVYTAAESNASAAKNLTVRCHINTDNIALYDITGDQLSNLARKELPETTNVATLCCDYSVNPIYASMADKPRINGVELMGNLNLSNFNGQTLLEPSEGIVMKHNSDWTLLGATYDEANKTVVPNQTSIIQVTSDTSDTPSLQSYNSTATNRIFTRIDETTIKPLAGMITPFYKNVTIFPMGTYNRNAMVIGIWDGENFKPKYFNTNTCMGSSSYSTVQKGPMCRVNQIFAQSSSASNQNIFSSYSRTSQSTFTQVTLPMQEQGTGLPYGYLYIGYDGTDYMFESIGYVYGSGFYDSMNNKPRVRRKWVPAETDRNILNECNAIWILPDSNIAGADKYAFKIVPGNATNQAIDCSIDFKSFDSYLPDTNADMYSTTISVKTDEESIKFDTNGKLRAATTPSYSTAYVLEQRISEDETDNAIYFTNTGKDALVTFNYTIANPAARSYDYEIYPDVESAPDVFQHYFYHVGFVTLPIRAGATIKITSESFNRVEAESTQYFLVTAIPFV